MLKLLQLPQTWKGRLKDVQRSLFKFSRRPSKEQSGHPLIYDGHGSATEDNSTCNDNSSDMEDNYGVNKDEFDNEETYFNFNSNYDFVPDCIKDTQG